MGGSAAMPRGILLSLLADALTIRSTHRETRNGRGSPSGRVCVSLSLWCASCLRGKRCQIQRTPISHSSARIPPYYFPFVPRLTHRALLFTLSHNGTKGAILFERQKEIIFLWKKAFFPLCVIVWKRERERFGKTRLSLVQFVSRACVYI